MIEQKRCHSCNNAILREVHHWEASGRYQIAQLLPKYVSTGDTTFLNSLHKRKVKTPSPLQKEPVCQSAEGYQ